MLPTKTSHSFYLAIQVKMTAISPLVLSLIVNTLENLLEKKNKQKLSKNCPCIVRVQRVQQGDI
jgi:hypothetical protein